MNLISIALACALASSTLVEAAIRIKDFATNKSELIGAASETEMTTNKVEDLRDPNSVSNIREFVTKHIHLDWTVDFDAKKIKGSAALEVYKNPGAGNTLKLDCSHLNVLKVSEAVKGISLPFKVDNEASKFGGLLSIELPQEASGTVSILIDYETTDKCSALQWLTAEQTAGKRHPYLFSQCQAIHARTMLPCQDSPSIKATYSAKVSVPAPIAVVMSANKRNQVESVDGKRIFIFEQTQPIPSYLIAIGAGDIVSRELGPRSAVWSEPEIVDKAAWEFAETEQFISIAEDLAGPYVWERYDILLLPPSFPYGGMENPCLTFLTPSLLAGDRSLVDVVAHEISHSWTGNLVSCVNWEHFWLNEGFTMFLERKILARLNGEEYRQFDSLLGLSELRESVAEMGPDGPGSALVPDLTQIDPDDVFSRVPYEKGYTLLYTLEELVDGPAVFEPFLKANIQHFAGQSINSAQFKEFILDYFKDNAAVASKLQAFDWDKWFYGRGMPPTTPNYGRTLYDPCVQLANVWISQGMMETTQDSFNTMKPAQRAMFFDQLMQRHAEITPAIVSAIDKYYELSTKDQNVEIMLNWYLLCIRTKSEQYYKDAAAFATRHGRMKYCRPILRELYQSGAVGKALALRTFEENRQFYHPIAFQMLMKDLQLK